MNEYHCNTCHQETRIEFTTENTVNLTCGCTIDRKKHQELQDRFNRISVEVMGDYGLKIDAPIKDKDLVKNIFLGEEGLVERLKEAGYDLSTLKFSVHKL